MTRWAMFELTVLALVLATMLWVVVRQRQHARNQARINEAHAKSVEAVGHDLDNLFSVVQANLSAATRESEGELRRTLENAQRATSSAQNIMKGLRHGPRAADAPLDSAESVLSLQTALLRQAGFDVRFLSEGDLCSPGPRSSAFRLFENLLLNAVREVEGEGGTVWVRLTENAVYVTNPTRDPSKLDDRIYQAGVSRAGSSGLGLAIAADAARELGWTLRHEVAGSDVTFVVEAPTAIEERDPALLS